jgi:hypothetical protein
VQGEHLIRYTREIVLPRIEAAIDEVEQAQSRRSDSVSLVSRERGRRPLSIARPRSMATDAVNPP